MKRKLVSILAVLLLLCLLPLGALAAREEAATVRSAYWTEGVLYTFVSLPQENPQQLAVSLFVNKEEKGHPENPQLLRETGATVHYLLLVDNASSMNQYAPQLSAFVRELMRDGGNLDISLASLSGEFQVLATGLTNWIAVKSQLENLGYPYDHSDICGGTAKALEYLGGESYGAGDVVNLVVITDGDTDGESINALETAMGAYPEIIVNTLCFGTWEEDAFAALCAGRGLHLTAGTTADSQEAARTFADTYAGLYTVTFPLPDCTGSMQLYLDNSWYAVGTVRSLTMEPASEGGIIVLPIIGETMPVLTQDPTEEPGAIRPTEPAVPQGNPAAEAADEEPTETATRPLEEDNGPIESDPPAGSPDAPYEGGEERGISPIAAAIGIAVAVLLIAAVVILRSKKKKA